MPIHLIDVLGTQVASILSPQPSVTTWHRLETEPAALDLAPGIEARIADPLWMIGRQWQFGELCGEDAGTPIGAVLDGTSSRVDLRGAPVTAHAADTLWEPLVEAEADAARACAGVAAAAGADLARALAAQGAAGAIPAFAAAFPFRAMATTEDEEDADLLVLAGTAGIDGLAFQDALAPHIDGAGTVTGLPGGVILAENIQSAALAAVAAWVNDWREMFLSPALAGAWRDRHLEYGFDLDTGAGDAPLALQVAEYADGRLDWWSMDAGGAVVAPAPAAQPIHAERVPVPVRYAGMPADRLWEFEDGSVSFAAATGGPTSVTTMLALDYVLSASNDWFHMPLTLDYGHAFTLNALTVLDTFGRKGRVERAGKGASGWTMFELALTGAPGQSSDTLVLPSVVAQTLEGEPIEEVALFRDEMANLVWARERVVAGLTAKGVVRREAGQVLNQAIDTTRPIDATMIYRMQTAVPRDWYPMTAEPVPGAALGNIQFRLRRLQRTVDLGEGGVMQDDGQPLGVLLRGPEGGLVVDEAEVPRAGIIVTRSFQMARTANGDRWLWLGRSKRTGRGEGSSGLQHDQLDPAPPAAEV